MAEQLKDISVGEILGPGEDEEEGNAKGIRSLILTYLRQNPEGVTARMVSMHANISITYAKQLLEELSHQREIYKRMVPGMTAVMYYPNGKLVHKYLQVSKDFGTQIFRVSVHEGRKSDRVQIQERRYTLLEGEKVEGSIFIDLKNVAGLIYRRGQLHMLCCNDA